MSMKEVNFTWLLPEGANPRSIPLLIVIAATVPPCKYQKKLQENSFKFQMKIVRIMPGNWKGEIYLPSTTDLVHIAQDQPIEFLLQ